RHERDRTLAHLRPRRRPAGPRPAVAVLDLPRVVDRFLPRAEAERWSWRRELNPRPADYKSAALPTELRQPDKLGMLARPVPDDQPFGTQIFGTAAGRAKSPAAGPAIPPSGVDGF